MKTHLPILPLRNADSLTLPNQFITIRVARPFTLAAVDEAMTNCDGFIILGVQFTETLESPQVGDLHPTGILAKIKRAIPQSNGRFALEVMGESRVGILNTENKIFSCTEEESSLGISQDGIKYVECEFTEFAIENKDGELTKIISDELSQSIESIKEKFPGIVLSTSPILTQQALSDFLDDIVTQLSITSSSEQKLKFLRAVSPVKRLEMLNSLLSTMDDVSGVGSNASPMDRSMGAASGDDSDLAILFKKLNDLDLPPKVRKVVNQEMKKMNAMAGNGASSEYHVTLNYLETIADLPWNVLTEDNLDIDHARKCLDDDHWGMDKVKERILEFLSVRTLSPDKIGTILCFAGPPGTGKTSCGKSIAKSMGREFVRMSLGGTQDEAEIRGHRKTYVGAIPGRIIDCVRQTGTMNPVIMLDEIDKLGKDFRGDPASALLEVLDPEQNKEFVDRYLGFPFYLSNVLFITTANEIHPIPAPLYDRMEVIEIPGYSPNDKLHIAKEHLVSKQKRENGLHDIDVSISDTALEKIIDEYTSEAGVRNLERQCGAVLRKVAVLVASKKEVPKIVEEDMITEYLGAPKVFAEKAAEQPEVGLSAGLAYSRHGGSLLFVETSLTPGKGKITLTGNLGKVLQESAKAAHTWIKANHESLGVSLDKLNKHDIHIHMPAGATPKDGPSAGIALTSAMLSSFTDVPVRNDIAMTGEITLRGRVTPIGGLKEKILAAHRAGIKTVIFPEKNIVHLEDLSEDIKKSMEFVTVKNVKEAIDLLLVKDVEEEPVDIDVGVNSEEVFCKSE